MNIIERYKLKKENDTPIKIVINSEFNYEDHEINVLKECLNLWAKDEMNCHSSIKYEWIYTNPKQEEKVFFVSTTIGELRRHKLDKIISNQIIMSNSYMSEVQNKFIFDTPNKETF